MRPTTLEAGLRERPVVVEAVTWKTRRPQPGAARINRQDQADQQQLHGCAQSGDHDLPSEA